MENLQNSNHYHQKIPTFAGLPQENEIILYEQNNQNMMAIWKVNCIQCNQLMENRLFLINLNLQYLFQLRFNQQQIKQILLQYTPNIIKIIQSFHFYQLNFKIQVS
ncbi:unnamed protein product [Paramecium sonneborni]|uniref:Uncharacterized protein n=1 Tax=Paramecium sonneborni TaxID=65129 RepID=A0A8S1RID3_9CILI|nr:unnamed protein product [Paramecium sonneborni]